MELKILYFAHVSRATGQKQEALAVEAPLSVADLRELLLKRHPALAELADQLLWSVNEEMAGEDDVVPAGATVALMPPFSGG